MKKKFLVFMDILGFKQIVENNETGKLLEIIRTFFQEFDSAVDKSRTYNSSSGKPDKICLHQLNFRLMSDSILIWTKKNTFSTFRNLLEATRELVAVGLENGFPLRGVLTYGDLIASKHIKCQFFSSDSIYGKALVEAYTLEKEMEWSGCIITPAAWEKCCEIWSKSQTNTDDPNAFFYRFPYLIWYDIPFKDGKKKGIAINWNADSFWKNGKEIDRFLLENSFSKWNRNSVDESKRKKEETIKFFEYTCLLRDYIRYAKAEESEKNIPTPSYNYHL